MGTTSEAAILDNKDIGFPPSWKSQQCLPTKLRLPSCLLQCYKGSCLLQCMQDSWLGGSTADS